MASFLAVCVYHSALALPDPNSTLREICAKSSLHVELQDRDALCTREFLCSGYREAYELRKCVSIQGLWDDEIHDMYGPVRREQCANRQSFTEEDKDFTCRKYVTCTTKGGGYSRVECRKESNNIPRGLEGDSEEQVASPEEDVGIRTYTDLFVGQANVFTAT